MSLSFPSNQSQTILFSTGFIYENMLIEEPSRNSSIPVDPDYSNRFYSDQRLYYYHKLDSATTYRHKRPKFQTKPLPSFHGLEEL